MTAVHACITMGFGFYSRSLYASFPSNPRHVERIECPDGKGDKTLPKTFMAKESEIEKKWYVIDAKGQVLGRLASQVAAILRGKHKPTFTPHIDSGDYVIVINADQVELTGKKEHDKIYFRHTLYPGGLKTRTASEMRRTRPEQMIELAVKGMLPKNSLGRRQLRKLKVYRGSEHPHQAQQPEVLSVNG